MTQFNLAYKLGKLIPWEFIHPVIIKTTKVDIPLDYLQAEAILVLLNFTGLWFYLFIFH